MCSVLQVKLLEPDLDKNRKDDIRLNSKNNLEWRYKVFGRTPVLVFALTLPTANFTADSRWTGEIDSSSLQSGISSRKKRGF